MWENRCKVAVSGVGFSRVTRSAEVPLAAHALTAVKEAVANLGLQLSDIDGLATYPELPATGHAELDGISIVSVNSMMAMLKLPNSAGTSRSERRTSVVRCSRRSTRCSPGCAKTRGGRSSATDAALTRTSRALRRRVPRSLRHPTASADPGKAWRSPIPAGSMAQPEPREDGDTCGDPAPSHPAQSARFVLRTQLSREDYLNSRMVAYPFCPFDCDIPVQGAVAIVSTTADRARDLKPRPAYLAGYGQRLHFEVAGRIGSLADYMEGGRSSVTELGSRSGFGPKDVDVAHIYYGPSASVIYGLESDGFWEAQGMALDFIQEVRIELYGQLPLNTFGGSLGTGRIHGLWHIIEGALQASGRAGSASGQGRQRLLRRRQRPDLTGTTFIFVRDPDGR